MSILYFSSSRQESMVIYKTVEAASKDENGGLWNQLLYLFQMALSLRHPLGLSPFY